MTTIKDIAEKTGYSITTVSKALNNYRDISDKARSAIMHAVREMGYFPNSHAKTLIQKRSWTIGLLYVEALGLGMQHPFFNSVIESFKKAAEVRGYDLMFISNYIGGRKISYLNHVSFRSMDGVVVVNSLDEAARELITSGIPCVVIDVETNQASTICSDNVGGSLLAMQHLNELGHTKIAHIAGSSATFAGRQRKEGYIHAMQNMNLPVCSGYIVDGGYFTVDGGYRAMHDLLDLDDRPTAVYAAGDYLALGAIQAIRDRNLSVPHDLSVVGFDDLELARYFTPNLTTIRQHTQRIGELAAHTLIRSVEDKKTIQHHVLPVELIIRHSTASPRRKE